MGNILFKAIAGMLAGVAAWAICEPFKPAFTDFDAWAGFEQKLFFFSALFLGATIGFMSGYQRGSKTHAWRECGISALFAFIGIMVSKLLAAPFAMMIGAGPLTIIGRIGAIAIVGGGLGAGIGLSTFVVRRGIQGMIGGLIGGGIAGALFDVVANLTGGIALTVQNVKAGHTGETGALSRGLTFAIMCGAIALMIGIIEALSRSAWLRLELGRNEGKEWVLDKANMLLGRFERADIPLFGDQNVAPQHASIQKQGNQYVVTDLGSPIGIAINGNRIQHAVLNAGDVLQIGSFNLRFLMRNVKAPNRGPEPNRNNSYAMGSVPNQYPHPQQPAAASQLNTPSQMAMQQQQMPTMMNPTMGQPMQPTMMNPTVMNQPYQPMDPTVAVPQGGFQPTMAVQSGMPTLVATDGPLAGQRFPLNMPIELGRECQQVSMAFDTSASRKHARIEQSGMFVNVTDLGSTNGTFVNGQRVTNAIAKNGDIVKVGATNFRIES